jgi:tripartite-type tricarboxylate transporter receptor subunit TctC
MKFPRREFLRLASGAIAIPAVSRIASAQTYPTRPITMIVPYPAGGLSDVLARLLADRMLESLGQPIIIENISGADGSTGIGRAARAKPDGHVIGLGTMSTHVLNGAIYSLPYDVLKNFAPISLLVSYPFVMFSRKTMPGKDLSGLIAWLRVNPHKGSAAIAATGYRLITVFFQRETGTQLTLVPYRGEAPAIQDLVANQIDLCFATPVPLALVRTGSIKAYATTSDMRLALAPDIPTFRELGMPSMSYSNWYGMFAPSGTPKGIIDKLNLASVEALADPAVRSRLIDLGQEIFPREKQTPEALGALVKADAAKWWPIIKELGIKVE